MEMHLRLAGCSQQSASRPRWSSDSVAAESTAPNTAAEKLHAGPRCDASGAV
jgi:hypothetical protein